MTEQTRSRPSLEDVDAATDRNGRDLGQVASGLTSENATEAETPPESLRGLRGGGPGAPASEAIERATASLGHDDGKR